MYKEVRMAKGLLCMAIRVAEGIHRLPQQPSFAQMTVLIQS
jgi:hypothetical protein